LHVCSECGVGGELGEIAEHRHAGKTAARSHQYMRGQLDPAGSCRQCNASNASRQTSRAVLEQSTLHTHHRWSRAERSRATARERCPRAWSRTTLQSRRKALQADGLHTWWLLEQIQCIAVYARYQQVYARRGVGIFQIAVEFDLYHVIFSSVCCARCDFRIA
jgi:hypothetical protein